MWKKGGKFNQHNNRNNRIAPNGNEQRLNRFHASIKEDEIGITEYVTPSSGFTGIIKHRISDFHVNEIGFDGKICKLTDLTAPQAPRTNTEQADNDAFIALVTEAKYVEIQEIENADKNEKKIVELDVTELDKSERKMIHHTVRQLFKQISTSTIQKDDKSFIKFCKQNKRDDRRTNEWVWPHEYTYFLLHKDNIDTMQAVSTLAPYLNGAAASSITYAGTKDKRAKTTQWLCIRRREPSTIIRGAQRLRNINVGNITFRDQPLKLGQLQGNHFRIALRQITASEDKINESMQNFKEKGFINYYGLQRFGNHSSVPTYQIGLALLKGDFKQACELIMKPRENDIPEMQVVREHWWKNRDATEALKLINRNSREARGIEQKLLVGFARNGPNDYINSLERIPRNVRLMYMHAYQSLIWNLIASQRIAKYGLNLCEGDLVLANKEATCEIIDDEIIDENETEEKANENESEMKEEPINPSRFREMVKPLKKSDIDSNAYTIFDVVLPMPGFDITYPANECAQWYEEQMAQDDMSSQKLKQKHKTYSLTGAYRKLLIKPDNLNWYFMNYQNETDTLIQSDIEELRNEPKPQSVPDGQFKALIVELSLPSSTYATMALREILKTDTSVASQIQLHENETAKLKREADTIIESENVDQKKAKLDE